MTIVTVALRFRMLHVVWCGVTVVASSMTTLIYINHRVYCYLLHSDATGKFKSGTFSRSIAVRVRAPFQNVSQQTKEKMEHPILLLLYGLHPEVFDVHLDFGRFI